MLVGDESKYSEDQRKWFYSAISAVVFLIIRAPYTYQLTDRYIAKPLGLSYLMPGGAVTGLGLIVHTLVFFFAVRLLMW